MGAHVTSLDAVRTPALLVDVDRLDANVADMAARYQAAGVALRPHVKTSKCWNVAQRQLAAGAIGFTCTTPAEIAWLRGHGVADLLWAQAPVGPAKIDFAVSTMRESGPFVVALDSVEVARPLAEAAQAAALVVPYVIEVNSGQARTGVDPDRLEPLAGKLAALEGLERRGIMTHEGHLSKIGNDRAAREQAGRGVGQLMAESAQQLRTAGYGVDIVSVGSTPGATSAPFVPGVTEARPGTYVYYDANQTRMGTTTLDHCALTVLARVISTQRAGVAIIDAGVKAMSSDALNAVNGLGIVCDVDLNPLDDVTFVDGNEEHGFLNGAGTERLAVGDLLRVVPNHACGTANMFSELLAVRAGAPTEKWPISARY
jgi:D-serine deaminase-like pyridoxal phosphate-dependent protein